MCLFVYIFLYCIFLYNFLQVIFAHEISSERRVYTGLQIMTHCLYNTASSLNRFSLSRGWSKVCSQYMEIDDIIQNSTQQVTNQLNVAAELPIQMSIGCTQKGLSNKSIYSPASLSWIGWRSGKFERMKIQHNSFLLFMLWKKIDIQIYWL